MSEDQGQARHSSPQWLPDGIDTGEGRLLSHIWVLIPAHRPALGHVLEALEPLGYLKDHVVVVTNGEDPIKVTELPVHVLTDPRPDVNISRWWNIGLDWIDGVEQFKPWGPTVGWQGRPYHVLIMNADCRIACSDVVQMSYELERHPRVAIAGPTPAPGVYLDTRTGPIAPNQRAPGWCFLLASQSLLRADERFRWWCGDDDLQWRARSSGGVLHVGPIRAVHLGNGTPQGELRKIASEDVWRFQEKYGVRPW